MLGCTLPPPAVYTLAKAMYTPPSHNYPVAPLLVGCSKVIDRGTRAQEEEEVVIVKDPFGELGRDMD